MSRREKTPLRMEPFRVDDELHRSIRVENREDAASTVPLEEALLLGQRILVMHPDSTLRSFGLPGFSYPRDPESPALRELKRELTDECRKPSAE